METTDDKAVALASQIRNVREKLIDGLFVVELEDGQAYLGEVDLTEDDVTIYTGFVGRPPVLPRAEVVSIVPAAEHADIVLELAHPEHQEQPGDR